MANKIPNRAVMCDVLKEAASNNKDVVVLCSDSRGSASLASFADSYPEQFVEVGIAEQNLVSIAAGLASCGKKAFAVSPASFISTRSYEQCKVDCAYSDTNVKLIGISGGVSYGALGMTHHSAQDIAAMSAIPNMRVYLPSDRFQTRCLFEALLKDNKTAYVRLGRNPVEDVYSENNVPFTMDKDVPFDYQSGDWIYIPGITSGIRNGQESFRAKVLSADGSVKDLTLYVRGLSDDEKQIVTEGCLMNYYAAGVADK